MAYRAQLRRRPCRRRWRLGALAVGAAGAIIDRVDERADVEPRAGGRSFPRFIDHDGRPRTDADFRGKLMLIYFGFTFCSNTCPTDLQAIAGSLDQLGAAGDAVQPLFITVDPEKDTPAQLKGYVRLFHPRMIGLTGSPKQIRKVANDYKVYYAKAEPLKRAHVDVDHSGFTFLVGWLGRSVSRLLLHPALRPTASPRRFARTSRCRPRANSPPAQRRPLRLANLKTVERNVLVLVPSQPD